MAGASVEFYSWVGLARACGERVECENKLGKAPSVGVRPPAVMIKSNLY